MRARLNTSFIITWMQLQLERQIILAFTLGIIKDTSQDSRGKTTTDKSTKKIARLNYKKRINRFISMQGRTHGGGEGRGTRPPWDLKNTIFSGFLPLNYAICISVVCFFLTFLLCGRTGEACRMIKSLGKVDFSHPTGNYIRKKFTPPLQKILGAPLSPCTARPSNNY